MLHTQNAAAACSPPATTYGTDTMTVSVPSAGTYYLWVRMEAPSSSSNSIMLQMDGGTCYNVGGSSSMPTGSLTWVNYQNGATSTPMTASLTQGSHTIELIGTDSGVSVDRVELLTDSSCIPSGNGDNCAPSSVAPPTVSLTSPTVGATVNGTSVAIAANASSASGVSQVGVADVVFEIDGSAIATVTSSPYTTTWNSATATNGTHTLTAVVTDTQGQSSSANETITVNNNNGCSTGPSTPSSLTATASTSTSITLGWGASTPATGCTITEYNLSQGGTVVQHPTTNSATLTGLSPNTTYSFSVTATDSSGHVSANSNTVNVTTKADTTAPSAPTNATASAVSASEVQLNWSAATDNIGVAYYRIYRNGVLYYSTTNSSTLSHLDTAASPSTTYTYQISAVDTSGNESSKAATTPTTVTTPAATDTTPPSQPTNLHSTLVTANSVALSWTASTDNVAVGGYYVYRNGSSTPVGTVTSGTSYTDNSLSASTTYSYTVKAFDKSGNLSTVSSSLNVTTLSGVSACSADLNNDGVVNAFDAAILFGHWGKTGATCADGDLNNDGVVNAFDAAILFGHWGQQG